MYEDSTVNSRLFEDRSPYAGDMEIFTSETVSVEANSLDVIHSLVTPSESFPATTRCSFLILSVWQFPVESTSSSEMERRTADD